MTEIIAVRFKAGGKQYYFDPNGLTIPVGVGVIVETGKGLEYGTCSRSNAMVRDDMVVQPLRPVVRNVEFEVVPVELDWELFSRLVSGSDLKEKEHFDYKWDMGWMNDTLRYFSAPFDQRPGLYHTITFSMEYFYNELYLLALSHDEVVHGKRTLIDKMWGDYHEKFAQARLLQFYFMLHPGKKLSFMGTELAHFREWDQDRAMDWCLLEYPMHQAFLRLARDLNKLYLQEPALYSGEYHSRRFQWVTCEAVEDGVFAFTRTSADGSTFLIVLNTQDKSHDQYPLYFDNACHARLVLCTNAPQYGGDGCPAAECWATPGGVLGKSHTLRLDLPALSGSLYRL